MPGPNEVNSRRNIWKGLSLQDLDVLPVNPAASYRRGGIPQVVGDVVDYAVPDLPSMDNVMNVAQGMYNTGEALYRGPNYIQATAPRTLGNRNQYGIPRHGAPPSYTAFHGQYVDASKQAPFQVPPEAFGDEVLPVTNMRSAHEVPGMQSMNYSGGRTGEEIALADWEERNSPGIVDMSELNQDDVIDYNVDQELWANDQDRGYEARKAEANLADKEAHLKWLAETSDPENPRHMMNFQNEVMAYNNAKEQMGIGAEGYNSREKALMQMKMQQGMDQANVMEVLAKGGGQAGPDPENIANALISLGIPEEVAAQNALVMSTLESSAVAKMFEDLMKQYNPKEDIVGLNNAFSAMSNPALGVGDSDSADAQMFRQAKSRLAAQLGRAYSTGSAREAQIEKSLKALIAKRQAQGGR